MPAIYFLLATIAGFACGVALSAKVFRAEAAVINDVSKLKQAIVNDFNVFHQRVTALEAAAEKKAKEIVNAVIH